MYYYLYMTQDEINDLKKDDPEDDKNPNDTPDEQVEDGIPTDNTISTAPPNNEAPDGV